MIRDAYLSDFVSALGEASLEEFLAACPYPALVDLTEVSLPELTPRISRADPPERQQELVQRRLRRILEDPAEARVLLLVPADPGKADKADKAVIVGRGGDLRLGGASVSTQHAQVQRRGASWLVEDLGSQNGTCLEGRRCAAGAGQPLVSGQELQFGDTRTLFLLPQDLHALLVLARAGSTRVVLPPTGVLLKHLRELIKSPNAPGPTSPPFLVELPLADATLGTTGPDVTQTVAEDVVLGLERDPTAPVWVHSVSPSDPDAPDVVVGRSEPADVILPTGSVSKRHALLRREGRLWQVLDLDSRNGTFLRNERLNPGVLTPINPGDQLTFATHRCVFLPPDMMRSMLQFLAKRVQERGGAAETPPVARPRPVRRPGGGPPQRTQPVRRPPTGRG